MPVEPRHAHIETLPQLVGSRLGTSTWQLVDQDRINRFAEATGDHQWIHVDEGRAAETALRTTIAHGYLTLSLAPVLLSEILEVDGCDMVINYGLDRLRFTAPLPSGSRVRLHADLAKAEKVRDGSLQATISLTFEVEATRKPCCVAEIVFRFYPQPLVAEGPSAPERGRRPAQRETPSRPAETPLQGTLLASNAQAVAAWARACADARTLGAATLGVAKPPSPWPLATLPATWHAAPAVAAAETMLIVTRFTAALLSSWLPQPPAAAVKQETGLVL
jgi:acyl dehydratase